MMTNAAIQKIENGYIVSWYIPFVPKENDNAASCYPSGGERKQMFVEKLEDAVSKLAEIFA